MGTPQDSDRTKQRIIDAAGRLFAEKGLHGATVREIVAAAETHLSALNYHFTDKQRLYDAVLEVALRSPQTNGFIDGCRSTCGTDSPDPGVFRERLYGFLTAISQDYAVDGGWQGKLVVRECLDPSPVFREKFGAIFHPVVTMTRGLFAQALGKPADDPASRFPALLMLICLDALLTYRGLLSSLVPELSERLNAPQSLASQLLDVFLPDRGRSPEGALVGTEGAACPLGGTGR